MRPSATSACPSAVALARAALRGLSTYWYICVYVLVHMCPHTSACPSAVALARAALRGKRRHQDGQSRMAHVKGVELVAA